MFVKKMTSQSYLINVNLNQCYCSSQSYVLSLIRFHIFISKLKYGSLYHYAIMEFMVLWKSVCLEAQMRVVVPFSIKPGLNS